VAAWKRYVQATGKSMAAEPKLLDKELNPGWRDAAIMTRSRR